MINLQIALLKMSVLVLQLTLATSTMPIQQNMAEIEGKESVLTDTSSSTIKVYLTEMAIKHEIPIERMLWIAEKESQWETDRVGDIDKVCPDGRQMRARGLWQIVNCWHDISDEEAFSVVSSTIYAIPYLKNKPEIWSGYRYCQKWFTKTCPF